MRSAANGGRPIRRGEGAGRQALSRRRFLAAGAGSLGAAGAVALGFGAAGLRREALAQDAATPAAGPGASPTAGGFPEPPVRASRDGVLAVTLVARPDAASGPGRMAYEGSVPGPTLRVRPGDLLRIALVNSLGGDETNLHVHGLHVSPRDNGDNVFVHVTNGETFDYAYQIPASHPAGLFWYHPHSHGDSSQQVAAGLAGAIVIEGGLDELPGIAGVPDRLLVLQGPFFGSDNRAQYLVNGQVNPVIDVRPGETQRWRLLNASANNFFNLQLVRHPLHQIAKDGNPLPAVQTSDTILLGPSERAEVLVQAGAAGLYELRSLAWAQDIRSQAQPEFLVATMVSAGEPVAPAPLPTTLLPFEDLSGATIDQRREITFQERTEPPIFAIDDKAFVEDRVDQTVKLGATEEWTIRNASPEWHPFHIHVNDFQVMAINGQPQPPHYQDTVPLPPNGEVVIRTRFADFTGKFVYHCHILGHEDAGMMAVVEVVE